MKNFIWSLSSAAHGMGRVLGQPNHKWAYFIREHMFAKTLSVLFHPRPDVCKDVSVILSKTTCSKIRQFYFTRDHMLAKTSVLFEEPLVYCKLLCLYSSFLQKTSLYITSIDPSALFWFNALRLLICEIHGSRPYCFIKTLVFQVNWDNKLLISIPQDFRL